DGAMLTRVRRLILKEKDVRDVTSLRARKVGQRHWIDIEARFDPRIEVSQVKKIIEVVKKSIMDEFERIEGVVVVSRAAEPELQETQP
ncbi:unnamed protein product, partial [marine sediment metagenome]